MSTDTVMSSDEDPLRSPIPSLLRGNVPTSTPLCESCQEVDPSRKAPVKETEDSWGPRQELTLRVWTWSELVASAHGCQLCEMVHGLVLADTREQATPGIVRLKRCYYPGRQIRFRLVDGKHQWLGPRRSTLTLCDRPGMTLDLFPTRGVSFQSIDLDLLRDWLSYCDTHHVKCATKPTTTVGKLRVIDCSTKEICKLPEGKPYVTLSYTWGLGSEENVNTSFPAEIPRTIRDAMSVTMSLGFRFLWVDRYCIPQDDEQEKNHQIQKMNIVYRNSTLTVIAAAGDGPHVGLPGINDTPRNTQLKSACIGADTIVYMADTSFSPVIEQSKWYSRAWTFQEGLLATRRIVFTETQVYFQCQEAHCWEIINADPVTLNGSSTLNVPWWHASAPFFYSLSHRISINDAMSDYFKKDISFPEDTLKAITGIFSHCVKRAKQPIRVLSGLILNPSILVYDIEGSWKPDDSIAWELAMCSALSWEEHPGIMKRECFPSWTWLGWTKAKEDAGVSFPLTSQPKLFLESRARITVGRQVEHEIHWSTLQNLDWVSSDCQITAEYLRISAWVFDAKTMASTTNISLEPFSRIGDNLFNLTQERALRLPIGSNILGMVLYEEYATNWLNSVPHHRIHYIFLSLSHRKVDSSVSCPYYERIGGGYLKLSMTEIGEEERDHDSGLSWDYKTSLTDLLGARQDTVHII